MKANIKKFIASNVRHWLTLGAGILVAKGFLDQESAAVAAEGVSSGVTELVLGGVMFLIGQGWSLVDKFTGKNKVLETAVLATKVESISLVTKDDLDKGLERVAEETKVVIVEALQAEKRVGGSLN